MFKHIKIKHQMFIFIGITFMLFVGATAVAIHGMNNAKNSFRNFLERDQAVLLAFTNLYAQGLQMGQALRNIQLDPANRKAYDNFDKAAGEFEKALDKARQLTAGDAEKSSIVEKIGALRQKQKGIQQEIITMVGGGDIEGAKTRTNKEETPVWREIRQLLMDIVKKMNDATATLKSDMLQNAERNQIASLAIAATAVVVGLLLALSMISGLTRQLDALLGSMKQLAGGRGDLTRRIDVKGENELAQTAQAFNDFMDGLHRIITGVQGNADQVSAAARELSATAHRLATSSHQQSEAAASTAAAVEEITTGINQVSDNVGSARENAEQATQLSTKGQALIANATTEMRRITETVHASSQSIESLRERSEQISGIANVIKEIADQTNLLALNAAIEAARAGEQGRGFAVVADEVRKLAERTGNATNEIKQMIETIQQETQGAVDQMASGNTQLESGARMVNELVAPLQAMREGANASLTNLTDLANATREQSAASVDIARHVEQIARMAEESSSAIDGAANSASQLEELATAMRTTIAQFRL